MQYIESFLWGIITALGALIIEIVFYIIALFFIDPLGAMSFTQFFIIPKFIIAAACIEEILKYIMISKRFSVLSPGKSKLINALLIGIGFFLFELVLILATRTSPAPQFLVEIAILHIGTAGLIGGILIIKNIKKVFAFICATIIAVTFHAVYNILSIERNSFNSYLVFSVLGLLIIINLGIFIRTRQDYRQIST